MRDIDAVHDGIIDVKTASKRVDIQVEPKVNQCNHKPVVQMDIISKYY